MASFNSVQLMGNLTRDVVLRYTKGGSPVANFGLAVNRKYKDQEEVCFVDITVWGSLAENCDKYIEKGRSVFVQGRLKLNQWETEEGPKRSKLEVVAENVQFLPGGEKDKSEDKEIPF